MMTNIQKKISLILLLACSCSHFVFGASTVELSDKNQAILGLDLSKSLKVIQDGFLNKFRFETVQKAHDFLIKCQAVQKVMKKTKDESFEGLAAGIKALLAEPKVASACSVNAKQVINEFTPLDSEFSVENSDYLYENKLNQLVELSNAVQRDSGLGVLMGHLVSKKIEEFSSALLENGGNDVTIAFGEEHEPEDMFDFAPRYKTGCEISDLTPICKLVRRSHSDKISAIAEDVKNFAQIVDSDPAKLEYHEKQSGVSLVDVAKGCSRIIRVPFFMAASQLDAYHSAGFITDEQINKQFQSDEMFHLYYELYHLCSQLAPSVSK